MRAASRVWVMWILLLATAACSGFAQPIRPLAGAPPGQTHDLRDWELQTCLNSPCIVDSASLATYSSEHFYLGDDGAIVMIAPDNATGCTTTHATHPRTELRETGVPDWRLQDAGTHTMRMTTAVVRVSSTNNETIIMQIHGSVNEEIAKVLKLRWTNGKVEARVKNHTAPFDEFGLDCGTYALNTTLEVTVVATGGASPRLAVTVNGKAVSYAPPFDVLDRYNFKAGDYSQRSVTPPFSKTDFAEVHLRKLQTVHTAN